MNPSIISTCTVFILAILTFQSLLVEYMGTHSSDAVKENKIWQDGNMNFPMPSQYNYNCQSLGKLDSRLLKLWPLGEHEVLQM